MQRRKNLFLLLILALSFMHPLFGQATPALFMTPAAQHAEIGSQFNVTINVRDIPGPPGQELRGCSLIIAFDPLLLQVVSLTNGSFLSSFGSIYTPLKAFNNTTGTIEYDASILGNDAMAVGSGDLLIVRFRSIASGAVGLTYTQHKLRDRGNYNIIHTIEEGTVYSGNANLYVDLPHTSVNQVGNQFTIRVNIENAFAVKGADVYLQFDPLKIEIVSKTLGDFFSSQGFTTLGMFNTQTSGLIKYNESITAPQGVGGQGAATLFTVVFRAKANGYGTLVFNTTETKLRNPENQPIAYTYENGSYDIGPIAVKLSSFEARTTLTGVLVEWKTENEIGVAGYNLNRTDVSLNRDCVVNSGLIIAQSSGANSHTYQFQDVPPHAGDYLYTLQEISSDGLVSNSEPLSLSFQTQNLVETASVTDFSLIDNYPNPFNSSTTIRLALSENDHVHLSIYDSTGRLVVVLTDAALLSGVHEIHWDGRDYNGQAVGSGTYFIRLATSTLQKTGRMSLMK